MTERTERNAAARPRRSQAGRVLAGLWIVVLLAVAAGAASLAVLGPPAPPVGAAASGSALPTPAAPTVPPAAAVRTPLTAPEPSAPPTLQR